MAKTMRCDGITSGAFGTYATLSDRWAAVGTLESMGFNYFVGYIDSGGRGQYGLHYSKAEWAGSGYYKDLKALIH